MAPIPLDEWYRRVDDAIADFEDRMRLVTPSYQIGDRVEYSLEVYEITGYTRKGMSSYWLRRGKEWQFVPVDMEVHMRPVGAEVEREAPLPEERGREAFTPSSLAWLGA